MTPEIVTLPPQVFAQIHTRAPIILLPFSIKSNFGKLVRFALKNNLVITGAPSCHYVNVTNKQINSRIWNITVFWELVLNIPVKQEFATNDEQISCAKVASTRYAKLIHKGSYKKLGQTHRQLLNWLKENKHEYRGESVEVYLNSPSNTKVSELTTEVLALI